MDEYFELNGITFSWNREKSRRNLVKHGVAFEQAAEAFLIRSSELQTLVPKKKLATPLLEWISDGIFSLSFTSSLKKIRSESYLLVKLLELRDGSMKIERLKKRLDRKRPMTTVMLRMPEDVVEDLKRIAPLLGFSGYQPLIRAYIGQSLREDLEKLDSDTVSALVASLKRRGVSEEVIEEALTEVMHG